MNTAIRDNAAAVLVYVAWFCKLGHRGRVRMGVNDPHPRDVWYLNNSPEQSLTSLRDRRNSGEASASDIIPRQWGFEVNHELPPGLIFEREYGSNNWWSVDAVRYDCETPEDSPCYTFESTITACDPQGSITTPAMPVPSVPIQVSSISSVDYQNDGNQLVVLAGIGFDSSVQVYFGGDESTGVLAANLTVLSPYCLQCEVPGGGPFNPPVFVYKRSDGSSAEM